MTQGFDLYAELKSLRNEWSVPAPDYLPTSRTINPYWDIVRTIPGNAIDWKYEHVWRPDWTASVLEGKGKLIDRHELCRQYTYAIPDPDSLDFVAHWLKPKAIELGAGTGYWSWSLSQLGVDILAYDIAPPQLVSTNDYHSPGSYNNLTGELSESFYPVEQGTPDILKEHADRTLFLCWPPMSDMAVQCLEHYQGKRLVYIGEGDGGCTADDAFFEKLEEEWEEIAEHRIVQWYGIHDWIYVYERNK